MANLLPIVYYSLTCGIMKLAIYQIDAFTNKLFGGNPAAVIPLNEWIPDELMQQLAFENNLSETAFFVPSASADADYDIRWFTPTVEINLCGHATLASSYALFNLLNYSKPAIRFSCKSGLLSTSKNADKITMDFPAWKPSPANDYHSDLAKALGGLTIKQVSQSRDLVVEVEQEETVKNCSPDFALLKNTGQKVILTAKGNTVDFVSRFFAPVIGIDEDPVTGAAHSQLIPYWAEKLGKNELHAFQLSKRGGELWCTLAADRVTMTGHCVFYMKGEIEL